jgi:hypothetical protein
MPIGGRAHGFSRAFLKKLFSRGAVYEELFDKMVKDGCDPEILAGLLFGACIIATGDREGFLDPRDISTAQLKRLSRDLLSLANLVERVNRSRLNPKIDILSAPSDITRVPIRKAMVYLYDKLPFTMRAYSIHLQRFLKLSRALLKRLTFVHFEVLRLLLYVEEVTGRPRYENISDLLTGGFLVAGGIEDNVPEFFSVEALAKLKQRTAKFGLTSRF